MSEIQLFNVGDANIRFGVTEDGTPYAVAADFAKALGYKQTKNALVNVDDDESGFVESETRSENGVVQKRRITVIYEDGLWELIFRSNLPGAKVIKKRVKEVLREIRETGGYLPKQLTPAEMLLGQAQRLVDHERAIAALASEVQTINAKISGIEGEHDSYAALGYAKRHGFPTDRPYLARIGQRATALMREQGEKPHKRQDATFGEINVYPSAYLEQAFAEVRRG